MTAITVIAIALVAFAAGIAVGFLLQGGIIDAIGRAVNEREAARREVALRSRRRPVERMRSGTLTDEDPATVAERERQQKAEERAAAMEAHRAIQAERAS